MGLPRSPNGVIADHGEGIAEVGLAGWTEGSGLASFVGWTITLDQTASDSLCQPEEPVRVRMEALGRGPEALAIGSCWGVLVQGAVPPPGYAKWPARPQLFTQVLAIPGSFRAAAVCRRAVAADSRSSRPVFLDVSGLMLSPGASLPSGFIPRAQPRKNNELKQNTHDHQYRETLPDLAGFTPWGAGQPSVRKLGASQSPILKFPAAR